MKNHYGFILILTLAIVFPNIMVAQDENTDENTKAYDLMSKYYNEDFSPFKKKNIYIGLAFSLEDLQQENTKGLIQDVVDGKSLKYNLLLKGGYYINNYTLIGLNFTYGQSKFTGQVFRDPDTLQSNTLIRSFDFTPNIRPSIPLTRNDRLSFFIEVGLTLGYNTALVRNTKKLDEVDTKYTEGFHFRAGLSPGVTFFAFESFAFEVQLDVIGYDLQINQESVNNDEPAREVNQKIDANINILTLKLGLAYYFGSKK